jgi:hypothetical protein
VNSDRILPAVGAVALTLFLSLSGGTVTANEAWTDYLEGAFLDGMVRGETCAGDAALVTPEGCTQSAYPPHQADNDNNESAQLSYQDSDIDCGLVASLESECVYLNATQLTAISSAVAEVAPDPVVTCAALGQLAGDAALAAGVSPFVAAQFEDFLLFEICANGFPNHPDGDGDGVGDRTDNCPSIPNSPQVDGDANGVGNVCEPNPPGCGGSFDLRIFGTNGPNVLEGTNGRDLIFGYGGDDFISGANNDDCLVGGDGNDIIVGGNGHDVILAGPGDDTISGLNGPDSIYCGTGIDFADGGNGADTYAAACEVVQN